MNHIKDWLVQLFCKHEYELIGDNIPAYETTWEVVHKEPSYYYRIYLCKKCFHKHIVKLR